MVDEPTQPGQQTPSESGSTEAAPMSPVRPGARIWVVDALRGFALLGILLVNMGLFRQPIYALMLPPPPDLALADRAATWLITLLAEGKFYSMFSLLFGFGFALQLRRAERRGAGFVPLYARRLAVLILFGMAHAFLLWTGDILILYGILGFGLILFRKARARTLLVWVGVIAAAYLVVIGLAWALLTYAASDEAIAAEIAAGTGMQEAAFERQLERAYDIYGSGTFVEVTRQRVREYLGFTTVGMLGMMPSVFAMFLIGMYFGRRRLFEDVAANARFFRRLALGGALIGLPLSWFYASGGAHAGFDLAGLIAWMPALMAQAVGAPALCLSYVGVLVLQSSKEAWAHRLRWLAPVGRMALTNYLVQSLVCTTIFYGYGFGMIGEVGAAAGLALTCAIYGVQVVASRAWLSRYRYGPAEWLWRSLTYMRWQPMLRS